MEAALVAWEESRITKKHLAKLHADGLLPDEVLGEWKAPINHRIPAPETGGLVC
jgi:hypothetical protein